jgi:hypothetical protein
MTRLSEPAAIPTRLQEPFLRSCRIGLEQRGRDGGRHAFTGSAQAIIDDIGRYRERGLQHFLIGGDGHDLNGTLDVLEQFASEVMRKFD